MEKRHDIKGILFNFSGTIDTEGSDWFDLIWKEYREIGIPITKSDYLAAHEFAEKEISEKGLIEPWFNFYFTLHTKLSLQIKYLISKGLLSHITISASFPTSIDPTLSSIPNTLAGFIVIASNAFSCFMPYLIAIPAHIGKY